MTPTLPCPAEGLLADLVQEVSLLVEELTHLPYALLPVALLDHWQTQLALAYLALTHEREERPV